jgi:hypothetical protein
MLLEKVIFHGFVEEDINEVVNPHNDREVQK